MAKNDESIEQLLDDTHEIIENNRERDAKLDKILEIVDRICLKINNSSELPSQNATLVSEDNIRNEVVAAIKQVRNERDALGQLSLVDADFDRFAEKVLDKFNEVISESNKTEALKAAKLKKEDDRKRDIQELHTMSQVQKWASDYPEIIQRWLRFAGLELFSGDAEKDLVHDSLRVLGDIMMAAGRSNQPPTLMVWLKYRWGLIRNYANKMQWLYYFSLYVLALISIFSIALYQNRLMKMDETCHVWYKTVIQTRKDDDNWHELDSILHNDDSFYNRLFKDK